MMHYFFLSQAIHLEQFFLQFGYALRLAICLVRRCITSSLFSWLLIKTFQILRCQELLYGGGGGGEGGHYPTQRPTYRPPTHRPTYRPTYRPTHRPTYRPPYTTTRRPWWRGSKDSTKLTDVVGIRYLFKRLRNAEEGGPDAELGAKCTSLEC